MTTISDLTSLPNSVDLARSLGTNRYFTGKPCRNGHLCERRVTGRRCVQCHRINFTKWRKGTGAEKFQGYRDRWAKANPEKVSARTLRWQKANPERHLANVKRWQERNPEQTRECRRLAHRARRAKLKGSGGKHTTADIQAITRAQKDKCAWCRISLRDVQRNIDHIVPLFLGGSDDRRNLQILCRPCNMTKGRKHPLEFARQEGRLL